MAPAAIKKFRVLIVDDSAFMRKVLETISTPTINCKWPVTPRTAAKQLPWLSR